MASRKENVAPRQEIPKSPTGIIGLDEITGGGLPARPADARLRRRRVRQDAAGDGVPRPRRRRVRRAGRLHAFEETAEELAAERRLAGLRPRRRWPRRRRSVVDYVRVERSEIEETGEYDLEGLFIRLGHAIDSIGAKRVVLDTHRGAVRRPVQRRHPARGAAPAVPLAEGQGRHRDHHRRARRGHADPPGPRGVRLRLRDPARPPRRPIRSRPAGCASSSTAAPRTAPTSIPSSSTSTASPCCRSRRSASITRRPRERDLHRRRRPRRRCSAARASIAAAACWSPAPRAPGKTSLAAHFVDAACRRGERCLYFAFEESAGADRPQHALDRHRPRAVDQEGLAAVPRARGPTASGWRSTWSRCTS